MRRLRFCQLSLNSDSLNEQQLYDFGIYRVSPGSAPVPGVTLRRGCGQYRQIMRPISTRQAAVAGINSLDIVNAVIPRT